MTESSLCDIMSSTITTSCVTVADSVTKAAGSSTIRAGNTMMDMLYYSVGVLGVLGNTLIIVVVMNNKKMKENVHDLYILNQSAVDLVSAVMLILLTATLKTSAYLDMTSWHGQILCHVWYSSLPLWGLFFVSTVNLIFLTLERYFEIVHPVWHKVHMSRKRAIYGVIIVWLMFFYQAIVHFSTTQVIDGTCKPLSKWRSSFARIFYGHFNATVRCYIPVGLMLFCYPAMLWKLRQQERRVGPLLNKKNQMMAKARRNIVMTLVTITIAYVSCWTLNQIIYLRFLHGHKLDFTSSIYNVSVALIFINCCINPFIYACYYKAFQNGVRQLVGRMLQRKKSVTFPSSTKPINTRRDEDKNTRETTSRSRETNNTREGPSSGQLFVVSVNTTDSAEILTEL